MEAGEAGEADIHLQLGHALKLLGREAEAGESYGRAVVLDPAEEAPWREWLALSDRLPAPRRAAGRWLDLTDLLAWLRHRRAPSGLQRVQWEVAAAAPPGTGLCALGPGPGWRPWPAPLLHRLRRLSATGSATEAPDWVEAREALESWLSRAADLDFASGSLLLTLGGTWHAPLLEPALRALREAGARHAVLVHDAGPLSRPRESDAATRAAFARWFAALPARASALLAVSETTAEEVRRLGARLWEEPGPPLAVTRPDGLTRLPGEGEGPPLPPPPWPPAGPAVTRHSALGVLSGRARAALRDAPPGEAPPVLMVASFEARKGHDLALEAWRLLLARRGAAGTPRLVLLGRRAGAEAAVEAALSTEPALAAKVSLLHDASDAELARHYRACLFTLLPSRHEGWGLPVSESLARGRVAVVAEAGALTESGEAGAVAFAPGRAEDLAAAVEGLLAPGALAAATARLAPGSGLRAWSEVAAEMLETAGRLSRLPRHPGPALTLGRALPFGLGAGEAAPPGLALAESLLRGPGWHAPERWGRWTRPGRAGLVLPCGDTGPLRLWLSLRDGPAARSPVRLALSREGAADAVLRRLPGEAEEVALEIGRGGAEVALSLEAAESGRAGERPVGVGLRALALLRGASPDARLAFLESRLLLLPPGGWGTG